MSTEGGCPRCAKLSEPLIAELRELRGHLMTQIRGEITTLERLLAIATAIAEIVLNEKLTSAGEPH